MLHGYSPWVDYSTALSTVGFANKPITDNDIDIDEEIRMMNGDT